MQNILLSMPHEVDLTGVKETASETLIEVAAGGYLNKSDVAIYRSVEALLRSAKRECYQTNDAGALDSAFRQILPLVPFEVSAYKAGLRQLKVFPLYDQAFEASLPMLLEEVASKASFDQDHPWLDPFDDLSDAAEAVRDHFRSLTQIDFEGTLLHKYVVESLGLVLRVMFNQVAHPPEGAGEFVQTVVTDLVAQISWMAAFFPDDAQEYWHISDATANLALLALDAIDHGQWDIADACASALGRIAVKLGLKRKTWDLANVHRDLEIIARGADVASEAQLAERARSLMTFPAGVGPQQLEFFQQAQQTRLQQLDEALDEAGRGRYRMRNDPVERLHDLTCKVRPATRRR